MYEVYPSSEGQIDPAHIISVDEEVITIDAIFQALAERNVEGESFKRRLIARERIPTARLTGTDRGFNSNTDWHRGADGEKELMREAGIFDQSQVTYVADLTPQTKNFLGEPTIKLQAHLALLIYDPAGLARLGNKSNGFHRFVPGLRRRSLMAIFEPASPGPHVPVASTPFQAKASGIDWSKVSFR